jgi:outer membrane protein OmpA-like peptidoglycan-associated protein
MRLIILSAICLALAALYSTQSVSAQNQPAETHGEELFSPNDNSATRPVFTLKTNALYGLGTLTPNLAAEVAIARRWTIEAAYSTHPWNSNTIDKKKFTHGIARLEARHWLKESFRAHFFGIHGLYSEYNISGVTLISIPPVFDKEYRYHGNAWGGGIDYGYDLPLGRRWNVEFTAGVGLYRLNYDRFSCNGCDRDATPKKMTYFGPSRLGVSVEFLIPGRSGKRPTSAGYAPPASAYAPPSPAQSVEPYRWVAAPPNPAPDQPDLPQTRTSVADGLSAEHSFVGPFDRFDRRNPLGVRGNGSEDGAKIFFRVRSSFIEAGYMNNEATLNDLVSAIRRMLSSPDSRIARIVVGGFASPEGGSQINDRLARERATAVKNYIVENTGMWSDRIVVYNGSVDWLGLRQRIEASTMPERDILLDIIDNVPVWDNRRNVGRLGTIMRLNGGDTYRRLLREHFPYLRSGAFIKVYYENYSVQ